MNYRDDATPWISFARAQASAPPLGNPCAPGAECIGIQGGSGSYCQPYCDPAPGAAGPDACSKLCPNYYWNFHEGAYAICIPDQ